MSRTCQPTSASGEAKTALQTTQGTKSEVAVIVLKRSLNGTSASGQ